MSEQNEKPKDWVRVKTFCKECKEVELVPTTLMAWIKRGKVPAVAVKQVGRFWFVHRERFMQWWENGHVATERKHGGRRG